MTVWFALSAASSAEVLTSTVDVHTLHYQTYEVTEVRHDKGTLKLHVEPDGTATLEVRLKTEFETTSSKYATRSGKSEKYEHENSAEWAAKGVWKMVDSIRTFTFTRRSYSGSEHVGDMEPLVLTCTAEKRLAREVHVCGLDWKRPEIDGLALEDAARHPWAHRVSGRGLGVPSEGRRVLWLTSSPAVLSRHGRIERTGRSALQWADSGAAP